ncbi:hypothetical protein QTO34_008083 [Cnephaeus nilssonii]|uniref:Reverse transcriptase domain-containing protein n=1 Tax=Cnephaeus nilssonii TaxID=3371016 RepID=A0AA40IAJ0_CNENI|nr:hypothetical protein QTO34_008083 [Eptesicus nilssonii]
MILSLAVPTEEEWRLYTAQSKDSPLEPELGKEFPLVWAEGNPLGLAKNHAPVLIDLKPGAQPNTPLLPVKKPGTNDYRLVQDLWAVNEAVITLHLAQPNPYTLLGLIPSEAEWFTCLDLKDALFCLQLAPSSQPLFAFEWENPTTGTKEQFTWTRLPQGFKNSPTLFSGALAADLSKFPGQNMGYVLHQYVDDLLPASSMKTQCWEGTRTLLRLLTETGYRVSKRKAQICQREQQIRDFLGAAGFCRIWIPGFSDLAKPHYEAFEGEEKAPINWGPEQEKAFTTIKTKLTEAPALGLPDVTRDFTLFIQENNGVA